MSSETRHQRAAFLGIERSLTGRRWAERLGDERIALAMAQRHGLPDAICRLLAAREVDLEGVPDFLEPTLRRFLPDPLHLKDMDVAVARLVRAVQAGERIVVFGDYDVDGATSSALLLRFFRSVGGNIGVYIPDRRKEGYGPNAPALLRLIETVWLLTGPYVNITFENETASDSATLNHRRIIRAVSRRDAARCRRAIEIDIGDACRFTLQELRRRAAKSGKPEPPGRQLR